MNKRVLKRFCLVFSKKHDRALASDDVVFLANDRCNQENLIEQLKNGVKAMNMPVDNLVSNWAYMVMASLAWTVKAWFAWVFEHKQSEAVMTERQFNEATRTAQRTETEAPRSGRAPPRAGSPTFTPQQGSLVWGLEQ